MIEKFRDCVWRYCLNYFIYNARCNDVGKKAKWEHNKTVKLIFNLNWIIQKIVISGFGKGMGRAERFYNF